MQDLVALQIEQWDQVGCFLLTKEIVAILNIRRSLYIALVLNQHRPDVKETSDQTVINTN